MAGYDAQDDVKGTRALTQATVACTLAAAALGLALSLPALASMLQGPLPAGALAVHRPAPQFDLTDLNGRPLTLEGTRGRARVVMFGYLGCDGLCQTQVAILAQARRMSRRSEALFLFVTMDPEHDTAARLSSGLAQAFPDLVLARPEDARDAALLARRFGAPFRRSADRRRLDHPGLVFLIDADDAVRYVFSGRQLDAAAVAEAVAELSPAPGTGAPLNEL